MDQGADGQDVVGSGNEQPRLSERLSALGHALWRSHARPIVAALLIVGLVGGSAYGWVRAHPGPLPVPALDVRATGVNSFIISDVASGELLHGALRVRLALTVKATERADETIEFLGLSGAGMAPLPSPLAKVGTAPSSAIEAATRVDCQQWNGFAGVRAHFRLSRDGRTREIDVPMNPIAEFEVTTAIQRPCAQYNATHPLRVVSVTQTLDSVLPIVHLVWTVNNPTAEPVVIKGSGGFSLASLVSSVNPGAEAGVASAQHIAARAAGTIRSTLVVSICDEPTPISLADQNFFLNGEPDLPGQPVRAGAAQWQVDLPFEASDQSELLARQACEGAPHAVTGGIALASTPATGAVKATLSGELVSPSIGSSQAPTAGLQVWLASLGSYYSGKAALPLGDIATVGADGNFSLVSHWQRGGCEDDLGAQLNLIVKGTREFPLAVPIISSDVAVVCHPTY